jgi:predicted hotdog family 3-hydroxylacyl-ACP dehydratase
MSQKQRHDAGQHKEHFMQKMSLLDQEWIRPRLPHQGSMCLLDQVCAWDQEKISCTSNSHRAPDNPLRSHQQLAAICAIEYAAQAMALHGALLSPEGEPPRLGFLASVRAVETRVKRLDDIAMPLTIRAERQGGDSRMVMYSFSIHAAEQLLLHGRASVILDADSLA